MPAWWEQPRRGNPGRALAEKERTRVAIDERAEACTGCDRDPDRDRAHHGGPDRTTERDEREERTTGE